MSSLATSLITRYNRPHHTHRASASRTPKSAVFSFRAARFTSNAKRPRAKVAASVSSLLHERARTFAGPWRRTSIVQQPLHNFPLGVAEWETKLVAKLPKNLEASLPTVEQLEAELMPKKRSKR